MEILLGEQQQRVRERRPLVHCITNAVTMNGCANMLLVAGASCTMAHHQLEVAEITSGCDALVCNLGATEYYDAMLLAAAAGSVRAHPLIIDPVGVGASTYRRNFFEQLCKVAKPTCVRGNLSEIQALVERQGTAPGVDVDHQKASAISEQQSACLAEQLARRLDCIIILSGAVDVVTNGKETFFIYNGHEKMTQITGTGCMSSALLGAYLGAANKNDSADELAACVAAVTVMGICGELAAEQNRQGKNGTMSFYLQLIDQMSLIEGEDLEKLKRVGSNASV